MEVRASSAIKPLNAPQPVEVRASPDGLPEAVRPPPLSAHGPGERTGLRVTQRDPTRRGWGPPGGAGPAQARGAPTAGATRAPGGWLAVEEIEDIWKIYDEWWRGADRRVERLYFAVFLENGQRATLYHDLARDCWNRQSD